MIYQKKHLTLSLALALAAGIAQAADFTWSASDMGPWDNAANWTPNGVPGAADHARITSPQPLFTAGNREVSRLSLDGGQGFIQVIGSGHSLLQVNETLSVRRAGQASAFRGHVRFDAGTLGLKLGALEVVGGRLILGQAHEQSSRALTRLEVAGEATLSEAAVVELFTDGATAAFGGIRFETSGGTFLLNNGAGASRSIHSGYLEGGERALLAGAGADRQRAITTLRLEASSGQHSFGGRLRDGENGAGNDNRLSLVKAGAFTQILTGANDFSGSIAVEGGELVIDGDHSQARGELTVASAGSLSGKGRLGGSVQVDGSLRPAGEGMDFNADLSLGADSRLAITLGSATQNGKAYLRGSADGTLTLSGMLIVRLGGQAPSAGDRIAVFADWGTVNGGFTGIRAEPLPAGLSWDVSQLHTDGVLIIR